MAETEKRERILSCLWDEDKNALVFSVKGKPGETRIETDGLPATVRNWLMLHGLEQKLRDKVAGAFKASGKDVSKFTELFIGTTSDIMADLRAEKWTGTKGDGTVREAGLLYEALSRLKPQTMPTPEAAKAWFAAQKESLQAEIRAVKAVVQMQGVIKTERAAARAEKTAAGAAALDAIA